MMENGASRLRGNLRHASLVVAYLSVSLLAAVLAWRCLCAHLPYFGLYHDDALYVVSARSLAEGHGHRIESLPGSPFQTKYPPFYPLILSFIWRLNPRFPENLFLIEGFDTLVGLAFAAVSVLYLVKTRRVTGSLGVVIFGATALNIKFLSFLPMSMSDLTYGLIAVGCLWWTETLVATRPARARIKTGALGVGGLSALATLTRTTGACLAAATSIYLLINRRARAALSSLVVFGLMAGPYWWWSLGGTSGHTSSSSLSPFLVFYTSHLRWMLDAYRDVGVLPIVAGKFADVFSSTQLILWPFIAQIPYTTLSPLAFFLVYRLGYGAIWVTFGLGMLADLRNRRRCLLPLYLFLYGLNLLVWPGWLEWRLILPILPFMYYLAFAGLWLLARHLKRLMPREFRSSWRRLCACLVVILSLYLVLGSAFSSLLRAGYYPRRLPQRVDIGVGEELGDTAAAYDWIRRNTPSRAAFIANNDPLLDLHTGRKGMSASAFEGRRVHSLELVTPETLVAAIAYAHADYILVDPCYGAGYQTYNQMVRSVAALAGRNALVLRPVYVSPHGVITVLKINRALLNR